MESDRLTLKLTGNSMSPLIKHNDTVEILIEVDQLELGDIILFKDIHSKELTLHRIVHLSPLKTKGDNSFYFDTEGATVIGKVIFATNKNGVKLNLDQSYFKKFLAYLSKRSLQSNSLRHFYKCLLRISVNLFITHQKS